MAAAADDADRVRTEVHHNNLLSTMSNKRESQEVHAAIQEHEAEAQGNKDEQEGLGIQGHAGSKAKAWEQKVQNVRDKRRKLRERGEKIEKDLATETVGLTRIFERVADSLLGMRKLYL